VSDLPAINASLNGASAICLACGYYFVRRHKLIAHRNCMITAVCFSVGFLACYLTYHALVKGVTHFYNPAWFRPYYRAILLTHTVLAAAIVPLVIITLSRALRERFDRHKKIARWTLPIWMYVSVTGVVIYLLLYKIFPQK
ncbi:MAG TPA: DUF420 domain-containing protein, partial [Verrucomicrobiae bacterium]|nr:DUF420 domain-containing protein [Verrucomicrobiae bacterium]